MSNEWKVGFEFLSPSAVEQNVLGQTLKFYPVSLGKLFTLRTLAAPLAAAITTLFQSHGQDTGSVHRKVGGDEEIVIEAITPELAKLRLDQKLKATENALAAVSDPKNVDIIAGLLMDSMRESFPPGKQQIPPVEFLQTFPATAFPDLLKGLIAANRGVLGPLAELVEGRVTKELGKARAAAAASPEAGATSSTASSE